MFLLLCSYLGIYIFTSTLSIIFKFLSKYGIRASSLTAKNPNPSHCHRRHPSCPTNHMLLGSMANESSSTIIIVPPRRPIVLTENDQPHNLIVLNVYARAPLKHIATNYSAWWLQFISILFGYDLLGFVDGSKPCPPAMITLPNVASHSPNSDHILWLRQN